MMLLARRIARSPNRRLAWMSLLILGPFFNTTHCNSTTNVESLPMNCFYCRVFFFERMISREGNDPRVKPTILSRSVEPESNHPARGGATASAKSTKKSKASATPCLTGTARLSLPQHSRLLGASLAHENR